MRRAHPPVPTERLMAEVPEGYVGAVVEKSVFAKRKGGNMGTRDAASAVGSARPRSRIAGAVPPASPYIYLILYVCDVYAAQNPIGPSRQSAVPPCVKGGYERVLKSIQQLMFS